MKPLSTIHVKLLGTVPDRVVAEKANVSIQVIFTERRKRDIKAFSPHIMTKRKKLTEENFMSLISKLGKVKDIVLASDYGISREYVRQLRNHRNITKFQK